MGNFTDWGQTGLRVNSNYGNITPYGRGGEKDEKTDTKDLSETDALSLWSWRVRV